MTHPFVHLHTHSEYSISEGILRIPNLLKQTEAMEMPAVALTDLNNLFGIVKFYRAALAAGIKPIIGAEILIENLAEPHKPFHLVLLCQNDQGYKNLIQLISQSYTDNQIQGKPIVKRNWLEDHAQGLIALSCGIKGDIGQALLTSNIDLAQNYLKSAQLNFPNRFYLEVQKIGHSQEDLYYQKALQFASQNQIPLVATNEACFLNQDDFEAHEARVCIHEGWILSDTRRPHRHTAQQYFRSTEEMNTLFSDLPQALQNSVEIARRCNLTLPLGQVFLPNFPIPQEFSTEEYLTKLAQVGLEKRFQKILNPQDPKSATQRTLYTQRLTRELEVIIKMGFAGYFLIVADFVRWSKENDIPVGPGRGSGAGSLVAYALDIIDLNPIPYNLLFERFLNPERVSMPDFDIDFCMIGRDRVIDYVAQKYGRKNVSQIITYGSMAARAVVRDVGRILGHGYGFVDKIAKLIPFTLGIKLEEALTQEPLLQERYQKDEEVRNIIDLAQKLEGLTRNVGKHAGGVVIAPSQLTDFTPLYCEESVQNLVSQFDKDDVEAIGLVKFDFLGLRTLTIIHHTLQIINRTKQQKQEEEIDINTIPLDDPAVYRFLKSHQTTAIFQLESRGMKDLIRRLQPDCFEEIIALVALFRPGPLQSGMVDDFVNRKHGQAPITYPHEKLTTILKPTYGVILYQEQVMQIGQILAGYSLGGADLLRRAMGKKKIKEMAKQRQIFTQGALEQGVDEKKSNEIFDAMEKFASYGFNKSHSAAYALITYQTAWLKTHFPIEFMTAVLSSDMDNTDKLINFIEECQAMKIVILPPDINTCEFVFTTRDKTILYGLGALKGAGEVAIDNIINQRTQHGPFKDLFEFCRRVDLRKVNHKVLEVLVKSGAMDGLGTHRAALLASLKEAVALAEKASLNRSQGQLDFLELLAETREDAHIKTHYVETTPFSEQQRLDYERESLGYYLTGHPLTHYLEELKKLSYAAISDLAQMIDKTVLFAGLVTKLRLTNTKRGDRMIFITLNDPSGTLEIPIFSDLYDTHREFCEKDQLLIIEGIITINNYNGNLRINAKRLFNITHLRETFASKLSIHMPAHEVSQKSIEQLSQILSSYRGGTCPIHITYQRDNIKALLPLGQDWHIVPTDELIQTLKNTFTTWSIEMVY